VRVAASPGPGSDHRSAVARRTASYVGGRYVGEEPARMVRGQMYVERWDPVEPRRPLPLVLVHGGGQTATNWMTTADGRPGWAEWFVGAGYTVYLVDQPARGRSPWHKDLYGPLMRLPAGFVERMFTATRELGTWPEAGMHTQWPGTGRVGDPVFDAFYAGQVPFLADFGEAEVLFREAGGALLDAIGPAVLLTHSQGGPLGWVLADARPELVRAIVAVEPYGPPFLAGPVPLNEPRDEPAPPIGAACPWGVTETPLASAPPVADPAVLGRVWAATRQGAAGTLGGVPRLTALGDVPVLVVTAEASYHAGYDDLTVGYLRAAGVPVEALRLGEHGIHGNGHMMMLEANSDVIAAAIAARLPGGEGPWRFR
jgi:pimeloyl-ACP methyl ester carboxylesterase